VFWILFVMGAIAAVVIALIAGGLATPRDHAVARTIVLRHDRDTVWSTVRNFDAYAEWRDELEHAEVVDTDQAQVRWRETSTRGSVTFGVTGEQAPERLSARILDDDLPFTGEWTWTLVVDDAGTRVTITERGSVPNPAFRFIAAHFMGYTKSLDRYLRGLAQRLGQPGITIDDATPA
jgi:hypothetical protein